MQMSMQQARDGVLIEFMPRRIRIAKIGKRMMHKRNRDARQPDASLSIAEVCPDLLLGQ